MTARARRAAVILAGVTIASIAVPAAGAQPETGTLQCGTSIAAVDDLAEHDGYTAFFHRVALLTTQTLQANPFPDARPHARYFAKTGLLTGGEAFELVVPERWRGRLSISWGGSGRTDHLRVPDCDTGDSQWIVFAGGYHVPEPACIRLVVKTEDRAKKVRVGVGKACPGQDPAPPPATQSASFASSAVRTWGHSVSRIEK